MVIVPHLALFRSKIELLNQSDEGYSQGSNEKRPPYFILTETSLESIMDASSRVHQTSSSTSFPLNLEAFAIADKVPGMIAVYNRLTGEYLYVNATVQSMLGYSPDDFIQGGLAFATSLVHPEDLPEIMRQNQAVIERANQSLTTSPGDEYIASFEYRMRHKSGEWRWLHTDGRVLSRNLQNEIETIINISIDITDRKESEQKILQDYANINYALDQSAIVAITDQAGMIQYVNEKFLEISQYSREELVGKTHRVVNSGVHPPSFFAEMWKTILSGKVWRGEIQNRAKNGEYYWVATTITPFLDERGQPQRLISIRHDITPRKKLERQKDEFIGIASHELKTPVTSLKGYIQVMYKRFVKNGDTVSAQHMQKMNAQVDKLSLLIEDLLDVTKIETGRLQLSQEEFDINILVQEIVEQLQLTTEKHVLKIRGKVDRLVSGDRDRIGQVIANLLSNAIKYSPAADEVIISLASTPQQLQISVQDFGVGIPPQKRQRVFERFYRVSGEKKSTFPGLGLGLYISSEIIQRHQGKIWVESEIGQGSQFHFTLPWRQTRGENL